MKKKNILGIVLGVTILGTSIAAIAAGNARHSRTDQTASKTAVESVAPTSFVQTASAGSILETADETPAFSYANVADVAEAVMPSIVAITNKSVQEINSFFYGRGYQYESTSAGSGIIVGENETELLVCTNNHVVEDASELSVTFIDEQSYTAYVTGTDPENDLAVVAVLLSDITDDTMGQIKIAKTGDSENMRVGEQVVAIGNALGYGQSVTTGIISAKDRTIQAGSGSYGNDANTYEGLIQTDAAINFGNSGGALLNMNGEVIGINSAKASSSGVEGMGYAIPVSKAMPILEDLMTRKTRVKLSEQECGYLGINGQSVSREATLLYSIPQGIYVTYVAPGSPAETAGIKEGDIITAFDGETLTSIQDLQYQLQYYAAGETVDIDLTSSDGMYYYNEKTLSVTLGDRNAA